MKVYDRHLKVLASTLRKNMTDAEKILWSRVRRKQVHGLQFYRQRPIASYIVDFYCPKANLVIELDGGQHFASTHRAQDEERDAQLNALGLQVLRFHNRQVLTETDAVMSVIWQVVGEVLDV